MLGNSKTVLRPKVRFTDSGPSKADPIEHCKENSAVRISGPKISSIVSLKKPVKIVTTKNSLNSCNKNLYINSCKTNISTSHDDISSDIIQSTSLSNNNMQEDISKNSNILRNTNGIENTKENHNIMKIDKVMCPQNNLRNCKKKIQQKGKENNNTVMKKIISNKNRTKIGIEDSQYTEIIAHEKLRFPTNKYKVRKINTEDTKSLKIIMPYAMPNITKGTINHNKGEIPVVKPVASSVMPCYKYKTTTRRKTSPIKKMALRNISGSEIKASIGICYNHQDDPKINDKNKKLIIKSNVAAEQLAQPEYNSIMCIFNKLKEVKRKKIVTEIDHLPFAQKNLVNGKISAALDFPLDEIIYKNLVDLTIDDKQLPSTIMRNKDPEPRQKDIVPKLDDFFIPEDTKEICTFVHLKPRALKIDENWNAFKISDKIIELKYNLDNIQ